VEHPARAHLCRELNPAPPISDVPYRRAGRKKNIAWRARRRRAATTVERARVDCLRADRTRPSIRADARSPSVSTISGISALEWSPHPTEDEERHEYERICSQLGDRSDRGALIDLLL